MEELVVTRKQRLAGNLTAGGAVIVAGLILLLSGTGVIPVSIRILAAPVLLSAVGLTLLAAALIQHNSVSLWISFAFTVPALVGYLVGFTSATYGQLYPLYIAIPAIASIFTLCMSTGVKDHLKVILLFGVTAGLFALNSSGLIGWGIALPLIVVYVGCIILYLALKSFRTNENEDDLNA